MRAAEMDDDDTAMTVLISDAGMQSESGGYSETEANGIVGVGEWTEEEDDTGEDSDPEIDEWTARQLKAANSTNVGTGQDGVGTGPEEMEGDAEGGAENDVDDDNNDREMGLGAHAPSMSFTELTSVLGAENVEVLSAGLARFNTALKRIVRLTVDHEVSAESDLVRAYLRVSPEVPELIRIWNFQQKHEVHRLDIQILDTIAYVLLASRLLNARNTGAHLARTIIRNHMKPLYKSLSSKKHALMQSTCRVLSGLVVQSSSCTRELFNTFNFTMKALPTLFRIKRTATDAGRMEDVRGLYIRFLLGFLMYGDTTVKKGILETKDAVSGIFKGSWEDHFLTIEFVLSVLKKKVVDDASLPRNFKQSFFNNFVLELLTKLYGRNDAGVAGNTALPLLEGSTETPRTVADLAHEFLLHLCTRPGFGICAQEPGWLQVRKIVAASGEAGMTVSTGRSHKQRNGHLLKWAVFLRPTEMELEMVALLELLKNCQELVQPYWAQLTLSFEPRLSPKWITNMALASNIISLPVPDLWSAAKTFNADPFTVLTPPSVATLAENILPNAIHRLAMGRALQHPSLTVRHVAAFVFGAALKKLTAVLAELERVRVNLLASKRDRTEADDRAAASTVAVEDEWFSLKVALVHEIRKRVPEVQLVLGLHMKITVGEDEKAKQGGKSTSKGKDEGEDDAITVPGEVEMEEDPTVTPIVMQCASLRLIREYHRHFPDQIAESRFDFGKLVPADISKSAVEIQKATLEFLLEVPQFKWWTNPAGSQNSHLQTLIQVQCHPDTTPEVKSLSQKVISHFLASSYIFQNNLDEVSLWLNTVSDFATITSTATSPSVISWFDAACCSAVKAPHKTIDRMAHIVDTVSSSLEPVDQSIMSHIYENRIIASSLRAESAPSSISDVVTSKDEEMDTDASFQNVFPFSPVMVCAMDGLLALLRSLQKVDASVSSDRMSQILGIAECFCVMGLNILSSTQGTSAFLAALIGEGLSTLGDTLPDAGSNFTATAPASYLKLLYSSTRGIPLGRTATIAQSLTSCASANSLALVLEQSPVALKSTLSALMESVDEHKSSQAAVSILGHLLPALQVPLFVGTESFANANRLSLLKSVLHLAANEQMDFPPDLIACFANVSSEECVMVVNSIFFWVQQHRETLHPTSVERAFEVLHILLVAVKKVGGNTWLQIRHFVFRHPLLLNAFLATGSILFSSCLKLVKTFLPSDHSKGKSDVYEEYIMQVRDTLVSEISPTSNYSISASSLEAFTAVRTFMNESDLNKILDSVLTIPIMNNTVQISLQNTLISLILTAQSASGALKRVVSGQAFRRLLKLLHDCPSDELDQIFEASVRGHFKTAGSVMIVLAEGSITNEKARVYAHIPSIVDLDTVKVLMIKPTESRMRVLKHLVSCSSVIRNWVLKEAASLKGNIADCVFESALSCLAVVQDYSVDWSDLATTFERTQIGKLKKSSDTFISQMNLRLFGGSTIEQFVSQSFDDDCKTVQRIIALKLTTSNCDGFLDAFVKKFLDLNEFTDIRGIIFWLEQYFDALVNAELVASEEGDLTHSVFSVFVKAIRAFFQTRKRVELPIQGNDPDFVFEACATSLLKKMQTFLQSSNTSLDIMSNGFASKDGVHILSDFFKTSLKYRMPDHTVVDTLTTFISMLYCNEGTRPIPLDQLLTMISGHSQFKYILKPASVSTSNFSANVKRIFGFHPCKASLVRLLRACINYADNETITNIKFNILPSLSTSYVGSQHESDRGILSIWYTFEANYGLSIATNAVHWGQMAAGEDQDSTAAIAASSGATGTVSASSASESLSLIDPVLMSQSIHGFSITDDLSGSEINHEGIHQGIYDASFFLPLIATAVKIGAEKIDMKKVVESNALGLGVMALASENELVRKAGYFILDVAYTRFYKIEDMKEKLQLTLLLTMLKNGIAERSDSIFPKLPTIIALFFSNALAILSKPEHFMYPLVNTFLLSRPTVDFEDVPMFYSLFNSSTDNCRRERVWLYKLLCGGLKNEADYKLYKRRHAIDLVMSFFHFPLADLAVRKLTFEVLSHR
ncbi:ribosome 60S biogenesis N-terminal-domain-containing protein [Chytriomyces sp. MP71]|nr:ribosome 60S biogenesis N-terminal-domain-containing protein [Chytriomyces sp. MP71]